MGQKEEEEENTEDNAASQTDLSTSKESAENMDIQDTSAVGKIRALMGMLTKFIGVKDIVNLYGLSCASLEMRSNLSFSRISLPASLLDPVSNLEYWNYMDRPDLFIQIPDPEDPLDRFLNVVKWWFSKDTRWMSNRIAKPYNSVLGEQFICHWNVDGSFAAPGRPSESSSVTILQPYPGKLQDSSVSNSVSTETRGEGECRVYWVNEQISHRPPVSCFYYYNKEKGISCRGVDHMGAKFTGASVKIFPGHLTKGLYLNLESRDNEEYNLTHPSGFVNGWLKASLWVSIGEESIISCPKTGLRAIIEYKDEPMFGRAKYAIQGKIYRYDPNSESATQHKKIAKIPDSETLCHITGCWKGQIFFKKTKVSESVRMSSYSIESEQSFYTANTKLSAASRQPYPLSENPTLLLDMNDSKPFEKMVSPLDEQSEWESRKIWRNVTENILKGNFNEATQQKREIEDAQRKREKEGSASGHHYKSVWFGFLDPNAIPASVCTKDELVDDGTMDLMQGKPFLRKSILKSLPWNKPQQQFGSLSSLKDAIKGVEKEKE